MKLSKDIIHVFKSADGQIQGISKMKYNGLGFIFEVIYDSKYNDIVEVISVC